MRDDIETFIRENFYVPDDIDLTAHASLLGAGIVDSTGVLEIVSFLEKKIGIEVDDMEIVPENMDSIANIQSFAARKRTKEWRSA